MPDLTILLPKLITAAIIVFASALVTLLLYRWRDRGGRRAQASHFSDDDSFETQQKLSRLAAELEDHKQLKSEAATRIQDLEQEIAATDKRQQETLQDVTRAKRSLANTTAALETAKTERDQLAQEREKFSQEREELTQARDQFANERDQLTRERDRFANQVAALKEERHRTPPPPEVPPHDPETDAKILELTEALRESEYKASRLGTEIQLLRTVRTEFEALRTDNRDLEDDLERLRVDNQAMENHVNRLTADAQAERSQRLQAEQELAQTKVELRKAQALAKHQPSVAATPVVEPPIDPNKDSLTAIEGISLGLEAKLNAVGITRYEQIAAWSEDDVRKFSEKLGFEDRIKRDRWVEHAQQLTSTQKQAAPTPPANKEPQVAVVAAADKEEIEQPSLFSTGESEDDDASLLQDDPALGKVYRRPPTTIDDLTRIKGIARVIEGRLHEIGIFRYEQICQWTPTNVEAFSKRLTFKDRIQRDRWIEQCQELHREKYGSA